VRAIFLVLLTVHGLIHLLGFAKAYNPAAINQLGQNISKANGIIWLVTALFFIATAVLFFLEKEYWLYAAAVAIILSQYLVIASWHDARFGTIANVIILVITIIGFGTNAFKNKYKQDVVSHQEQTARIQDTLLTEADIQHLPEPVKKYIRYTGCINKPRVKSFKIIFNGQIRKNEQSEWMPFRSEQYNFVDAATRLFFMNASMKHLPVAGFHCFKNGSAFMDIRLLSLFKVQYQSGKEMDTTETVTFFNDLCCMAPAALIDNRIKWLDAGNNKINAIFTNDNISISAWLFFNNKGELINFVSDDRFAYTENNTMKRLRWSTPLKDYKEFSGHHLASYAAVVYAYPQRDFCYGNFRLESIEYNPEEFK